MRTEQGQSTSVALNISNSVLWLWDERWFCLLQWNQSVCPPKRNIPDNLTDFFIRFWPNLLFRGRVLQYLFVYASCATCLMPPIKLWQKFEGFVHLNAEKKISQTPLIHTLTKLQAESQSVRLKKQGEMFVVFGPSDFTVPGDPHVYFCLFFDLWNNLILMW